MQKVWGEDTGLKAHREKQDYLSFHLSMARFKFNLVLEFRVAHTSTQQKINAKINVIQCIKMNWL